jgi:hypothetical protein
MTLAKLKRGMMGCVQPQPRENRGPAGRNGVAASSSVTTTLVCYSSVRLVP